jgi:hypothetical protein
MSPNRKGVLSLECFRLGRRTIELATDVNCDGRTEIPASGYRRVASIQTSDGLDFATRIELGIP